MSRKVVILFGSKADLDFAEPMKQLLKKFEINFEQRIASAHKTPRELLGILKDYEKSGDELVYVTIAGRSNALSGMVDANTRYPVIACPPRPEKSWSVDIYSSLRMPSGVAPLVILNPESAALAAVKILGLGDRRLAKKIADYQSTMKKKIKVSDQSLRRRK